MGCSTKNWGCKNKGVLAKETGCVMYMVVFSQKLGVFFHKLWVLYKWGSLPKTGGVSYMGVLYQKTGGVTNKGVLAKETGV